MDVLIKKILQFTSNLGVLKATVLITVISISVSVCITYLGMTIWEMDGLGFALALSCSLSTAHSAGSLIYHLKTR